jgi:drug/metabolite transporter (DMT)-like permease
VVVGVQGSWMLMLEATTILLALFAAFLFAASNSLQQHAVQTVGGHPAPRRHNVGSPLSITRLLPQLTRSPVWLVGVAANLSGTGVQAVALHTGSVAVVQLVLTTQLIFTLPLGSAWRHRWPRPADWLAALAICLGLTLFLTFPGVAPPAGVPNAARAAAAAAVGLGAAAVLVLTARGRPPLLRTWMFAAASGICAAISALVLKLTVADLTNRGFSAAARDWPGYVLAVAIIASFLLEQEAFVCGSLATAVAVLSTTNPVASYFLHNIAFEARLPHTPAAIGALLGVAVLIISGIVGLSGSSIVQAEFRNRRRRRRSAP